jgi:hypothetical protein
LGFGMAVPGQAGQTALPSGTWVASLARDPARRARAGLDWNAGSGTIDP